MTPSWLYGTAWKKERTRDLVVQAVKQGFRAIDTANQAKHYNEPAVGEALAALALEGVSRDQLWLQTKFTPIDGQDHRLPYDPKAPVAAQVRQSFESSLAHLGVTALDSYLLHGPYHHPHLGAEDFEVWGEMEKLHDEGLTQRIGISNVNPIQLAELLEHARIAPTFVQNRCFASRGWDRDTREICREFGVTYQGFSLLTANSEWLDHPAIRTPAQRLGATPNQVVFCFAQQVGMLPLTGTTDAGHMKEDLAIEGLKLTPEEAQAIETLAQ